MLLAAAAFAAAGAGAKEVATYNRDNFKWDLEQRLERETWRLDMQVKRFELFREDVRDLVNLTVDRMDIYHLVGALFLSFCVVLFVEGRIHEAPPFMLMLYLLTNACAFIYMLLAVWLSMHASIAAHSFGVRLLTRFVRLPIPSIKQLNTLTYQLKDYEKQSVTNILRLPFLDRSGNEWKNVKENTEDLDKPFMPPTSGGTQGPPTATSKSQGCSGGGAEPLLPTEMESPIGGEDLLTGNCGATPGRHVQLFRTLQSKWQCYDAYCRVCMGLGLNQMLQALSYYSVCHAIVENNSPSLGFFMILVFQSTAIALAMLDLAGLNRGEILFIQLVGMTPCVLAASFAVHAKWGTFKAIPIEYEFRYSPLCFLFQTIWLGLWLGVAAPTCVQSSLPRRFRQVLFLDVFGDATGWTPGARKDDDLGGLEEFRKKEQCGKKAMVALKFAQSGIQRWLSAPGDSLTDSQAQKVADIADRFDATLQHIRDELVELELTADMEEDLSALDHPLRVWEELSPDEQQMDALRGCLIGPFERQTRLGKRDYHFDVETNKEFFHDSEHSGGYMLDLQYVEGLMASAEQAQEALTECRIKEHIQEADRDLAPNVPSSRQRASFPESAPPRRCDRCRCLCCPNLLNIWKKEIREVRAHAPRSRRDDPVVPGTLGGTLGMQPSFGGESMAVHGPPKRFSHTPSTLELSAREGSQIFPGTATNRSLAPPAFSTRGISFPGGPPPTSSWAPPPADTQRTQRTRVGSDIDEEEPDEHPQSAGVSQKDPTLKAIAGQNAQHFAPERLPWLVLSSTTRFLQFVWICAGLSHVLNNAGIGIGKKYEKEDTHDQGGGGHDDADQDLCAVQRLLFEPLELSWPHGSLFNPVGIFADAERPEELLVASPFALYRSSGLAGIELRLEELERLRLPRQSAFFCLSRVSRADAAATLSPGDLQAASRQVPVLRQPCLSVSAHEGGLAFRLIGSEVEVNVTLAGPRWLQLTGVAAPCTSVQSLSPASVRKANATDCAVLAGWTGERLAVAVLPLRPLGGSGGLLAEGFASASVFELPLPRDRFQHQGFSTLHLEGRSLRLWILSGSGRLDAWDLRRAVLRGSWTPKWELLGGDLFRPKALFDGGDRGLYVVGRGRRSAPLLLRSPPPLAAKAIDALPLTVDT